MVQWATALQYVENGETRGILLERFSLHTQKITLYTDLVNQPINQKPDTFERRKKEICQILILEEWNQVVRVRCLSDPDPISC